mmetsp:Transcript_53164/g.108435  ORF Transcript_53164/g.108435 Transcript_53164/m.108435 type:complete len:154 (-) Transcript_53164:174-635(-)
MHGQDALFSSFGTVGRVSSVSCVSSNDSIFAWHSGVSIHFNYRIQRKYTVDGYKSIAQPLNTRLHFRWFQSCWANYFAQHGCSLAQRVFLLTIHLSRALYARWDVLCHAKDVGAEAGWTLSASSCDANCVAGCRCGFSSIANCALLANLFGHE